MPKQSEVIYHTPRQPRQLRLDTTTQCNAHCLACHRFLTERKGEMPRELIEQILKDISGWQKPLEEIVPVNYGEFFLRKDWYEILRMIATKLPNTEITLATNGSLVDEEVITKLCEIPNFRVINFSVNAYYDETYEQFMGLKADVIPQIRKAISIFRVLRPDIRRKASMIFDPQYMTDLDRDYFEWYWKEWAEVWIIAAASAGRPDKTPTNPVILPCRSIFSDIVVGYDGKISSCCFDANFSLDLGYYKNNLFGSWHSPELEELRKLHNERQREKIPLCSCCTFA